MRDYDGVLSFNPRLPRQIRHLQFPLYTRGQCLEVTVERKKVSYLLREGTELTIFHRGNEVHLTQGKMEVYTD
jgi:alpha,alpha-trehalose phosphorylase